MSFLSKMKVNFARNLSSKKVVVNVCKASATQCNAILVQRMSSKVDIKAPSPKKIPERMSLVDILSTELTSSEADDDLDNELVEIINDVKKNFTIVDQPGNTIVTLTRKTGQETIEVSFDCQDEIEDEFNDQEEIDFDDDEKVRRRTIVVRYIFYEFVIILSIVLLILLIIFTEGASEG